MDNSSPKKLAPNEAQRRLLALTTKAMAQIDIAARAPLARDRARALRQLDRALKALSDRKIG